MYRALWLCCGESSLHSHELCVLERQNCIIDGQRVLMGSMFWPEDGTFRNFDTVVVQGDTTYIRQLTHEFEELWN